MNAGFKISLVVGMSIWSTYAQTHGDPATSQDETVTFYKQAHEEGLEGSKIIAKGFPTRAQKGALISGTMDEHTSMSILLKDIEFVSMRPTTELELMQALVISQFGGTTSSVNFNQDTGMTEIKYTFKLVDMAKCVSTYLGNFRKVANEETLAAMNKHPGYFSWTSVEACLRCLKVMAQVKKHGPESEVFFTADGANKDKRVCPLYGEKLPSEVAAELLEKDAKKNNNRQLESGER